MSAKCAHKVHDEGHYLSRQGMEPHVRLLVLHYPIMTASALVSMTYLHACACIPVQMCLSLDQLTGAILYGCSEDKIKCVAFMLWCTRVVLGR